MAENRNLDEVEEEEEEGSWLTSYSDLMTDLLAIFVLLFSWALITQGSSSAAADTNADAAGAAGISGAVTEAYSSAADGDAAGASSSESDQKVSDAIHTGDGKELGGYADTDDEFDGIYLTIKKKIDESGYSDSIILEKSTEYIKFRFNDSVLFYPDSAVMRESSFDILKYMGDLLYSVDDNIQSIEIGGHTATTGIKTTSFFSWELSANRAIEVLKFFVSNCSLPESKMVISGYSRYQPVAGNDTEQARAQNRRVEVKITRVTAGAGQSAD